MGVKPSPNRNQVHVFLLKRIFSFGVVITVAFLLLVSLVISSTFGLIRDRFTTSLGTEAYLLELATSVVGFVIVASLFAVMFRYLPDARIAWTASPGRFDGDEGRSAIDVRLASS